MINLAGDLGCDIPIKKELDEAGIEYVEYDVFASGREVPSKVRGIYRGWEFKRAWYFWVATAVHGVVLPMDDAEKLHQAHGKEVRVAGHYGCPSPREWYKQPWHVGVDLYHIDTQIGLNAFAEAICATVLKRDG